MCGPKQNWGEQKEGQWAWGSGNDGKSETFWNSDTRCPVVTDFLNYTVSTVNFLVKATDGLEAVGVIRGWDENA